MTTRGASIGGNTSPAVSEIVGVMLMVVLSVSIFGVLYLNVTDLHWLPKVNKPVPEIYACLGYTSIQIGHQGGLSVSKYTIFRNSVAVKNGTSFVIGDRIIVPAQTHDDILMVDTENNEILIQLNDIHLPVAPIPPPPPTKENLTVISFSNFYTGWIRVGTSPYINLLDQVNNINTNTEGVKVGWFDFQNTTLSGSSFLVNISFYCWDTDGIGRAGVYVDYTGGAGTSVGVIAKHTTKQNDTLQLGTHTLTEVNKLRIYFVSAGSTFVDYAVVKVKIA